MNELFLITLIVILCILQISSIVLFIMGEFKISYILSLTIIVLSSIITIIYAVNESYFSITYLLVMLLWIASANITKKLL